MGSFVKAILVGLGSIGKTHLKVMSALNLEHLIVVDIDQKRRVELEGYLNPVSFFESLPEVKEQNGNRFAVIANWGPDHFSFVSRLMDSGIRNFIVEKPLVSRLKDVEHLRKLLSKNRIKIASCFPLNHTHLIDRIQGLATQDKLGSLVAINVTGGAKCLVTNGIHYLALANRLFSNPPNSVFAGVKNDKINPRNKKLLFAGGSAHWEFPGQRYLSIAFSNESHNQLVAVLEFSFGRILLEGNRAAVYLISKEDRSTCIKPTQTRYPKYSDADSFDVSDNEPDLGIKNIYSYFLDQKEAVKLETGLAECEAIIAMLISHEMGRRVSLPLAKSIKLKYFSREWNIS